MFALWISLVPVNRIETGSIQWKFLIITPTTLPPSRCDLLWQEVSVERAGEGMMNGKEIFEVFLLSQMRPTKLVENALFSLGVTSQADVEDCCAEAEKYQVHVPGYYLDGYFDMLGKPEMDYLQVSPEKYRRRVLVYHLGMWPLFNLNVFASRENNRVGSTSFSRKVSETSPLISTSDVAKHLFPWQIVEDDLCSLDGATLVDSWYPWAQYLWKEQGDHSAANTWLLDFDFGLLQIVSSA